ncbi:amidohydrolase family protein [Halomonas almeriensis]|uniref:amidohydrolase family protein n=1 Tax=Halomonas almeriensis TaxID=308163 RepID=UPI0025B29321|nr:amidohydrolase family protein [Halomonas almeriensis]MDN3552229.1 amidohydrolase family protein [Halomonas almeriensis]
MLAAFHAGVVAGAEPWGINLSVLFSHNLFFLHGLGVCVLMRLIIDKAGLSSYVDDESLKRITGSSVDFMVVGTLMSIQFLVLYALLTPILLVTVAVTAVTLIGCLCIGRLSGQLGHERALTSFGCCCGSTGTGLLLLRMMDADFSTSVPKELAFFNLAIIITNFPILFVFAPLVPTLGTWGYIAVFGGTALVFLAVGPESSMPSLDDVILDERFADRVILPGFVEGHSHALEGAMWNYLYLGYFPRHDPDGRAWEGVRCMASVQERLREQAEKMPDGTPLVAWGFDPVYFEGDRLARGVLDGAVADRPVVVIHASLHVMTVNTRMLRLAGLEAHAGIEGIMLDDRGVPTGELQEMAAMHAIFEALDMNLFEAVAAPDTLRRYGRVACHAGVTTITDLYNPFTDDGLEALQQVTAEPDYPVRLVPAMSGLAWSLDEGVERLQACRGLGNDKLYFGPVKLMTDGSIQGYTARLKWPHYHDGHPNGIWNAPPEVLYDMVQAYQQAGIQVHIHTNGDEAVELMLDALDEALALWPRADHRHTLQHCQIIDHAQMRRAARLGLCLNMFANHIYYWGDIHYTRTLGHERCQRLEPLASASRMKIPVALHSDAPVTPLGPLFTAWCAVMRQTASGARLGEHERVSVEHVLEMITLGAAYTLHLDHLVGSLEIGKFADMVVLEEDPLACAPEHLKDIGIQATVLGGLVHDKG